VRDKVIGVKITTSALTVEIQIPESITQIDCWIFGIDSITRGERKVIGIVMVRVIPVAVSPQNRPSIR